MESKITGERLEINLTSVEASDLYHGETVTSPSPIHPDASVRVMPYTEYKPDYRPLSINQILSSKYRERVRLLGTIIFHADRNLDLYVVPEIPMHSREWHIPIPRGRVATPGDNTPGKERLKMLPQNGIILNIAGAN